MHTPMKIHRTTRELIRDIDLAILAEESILNEMTDPDLIDSSLLLIDSLKKKRSAMYRFAVQEAKQEEELSSAQNPTYKPTSPYRKIVRQTRRLFGRTSEIVLSDSPE